MFAGFAVGNDRGKLIMACGTGKTFTALKIAERMAADERRQRPRAVPRAVDLAAVARRCGSGPRRPSWTCARSRSARTPRSAGCATPRTSTSTTCRSRPPPTRPSWSQTMAHRKRAKGLTVVFSTYQSIRAVAEAQELGLADFDLVICDEAHRTTGVTLAGEDESNFVRVHDTDYLQADAPAVHDRHPAASTTTTRQGQGRRALRRARLDGRRDSSTARSSTGSASATPSNAACSPTTRCSSSPSTSR